MPKTTPQNAYTYRGTKRETTKFDHQSSRAQLESDLSTFEKAGGKIEKLADTKRLKHIP